MKGLDFEEGSLRNGLCAWNWTSLDFGGQAHVGKYDLVRIVGWMVDAESP